MNNNFRDYSIDENIKELYKKLRTNQTVGFVENCLSKYCNFFGRVITIWEALGKLDNFIDVSDPDINLPNINHLFQTAEGIRKANLPEWMQVVGLIHDLGKVLYKKNKNLEEARTDGISEDTQWGLVGDTFILGHRIPNTAIFPEFNEFNQASFYFSCS